MFKTFIFGIVLGVAAAIGGLYFVPVVDQAREQSVITVAQNGGSMERFHINIPMDRIVVGARDQDRPVPPELDWPEDLDGVRADMYKLRNVHDAVVGVASRVVLAESGEQPVIEWVLHLPARGSMYVSMRPLTGEGGNRLGELLSGTREFDNASGSLEEQWVEDSGGDEDRRGRIELRSVYRAADRETT